MLASIKPIVYFCLITIVLIVYASPGIIAINPDRFDKLITALRTAIDNDETWVKKPHHIMTYLMHLGLVSLIFTALKIIGPMQSGFDNENLESKKMNKKSVTSKQKRYADI
jgi:hypothetical protein